MVLTALLSSEIQKKTAEKSYKSKLMVDIIFC